MKRIIGILKLLGFVLVGLFCLRVADAAGLLVNVLRGSGVWVATAGEVAASAVLGLAAARWFPRAWAVVGIIPVLYFGLMAIRLYAIEMFWHGLHLPLSLLTCLVVAWVGVRLHGRAGAVRDPQ